MPDFIDNTKEIGVQFEEFESKLDILMYYVAMSSHSQSEETDCQPFVSTFPFFCVYYSNKSWLIH